MTEKQRAEFDATLEAPLKLIDPTRPPTATMPTQAGVNSDIEAMMAIMAMPQQAGG